MGWDALHRRATLELDEWAAPSPTQDGLRRRYLELLSRHRDGHRKQGPGRHLTASCVVLDPGASRVLLTHHAKALRWLQFGGHLEEHDRSLAEAALREATEESGVAGLRLAGGIVELDEHELVGPFGRCTVHCDVRFVALAPDGAEPVISTESLDVAWFAVEDLPHPDLSDLVAAAVQRVRGG